MLGVYGSGHPFENYISAFKNCSFNCSLLSDTEEDEDGTVTYNSLKDGQQVTMGGIVSAVKKLNTKQGASMAFVTVEDLYGSVECVAFPNTYEKIKSFLAPDVVVALSGRLDLSDGRRPTVLLDNMQEFDGENLKKEKDGAGGAQQPQKQGVLWLNATALDEGEFEELQDMLSAYEGPTEVKILRGRQKFLYPRGVVRSKAFEAELSTFLPAECVKYV